MRSYKEEIAPNKSVTVQSQRDPPSLWGFRAGSAFPHREGEQINEFSRMNLKMLTMPNFSWTEEVKEKGETVLVQVFTNNSFTLSVL